MGKASRKKKLRKIKEAEEAVLPHKAAEKVSLKRLAAEKTKAAKKAAALVADKAAKKLKAAGKSARGEKATAKADEKADAKVKEKTASAAKHVKKNKKTAEKSPAVRAKEATVLEIPAEERGYLASAGKALKSHFKEVKNEYVSGLDQEKLARFKREAAAVAKGGIYSTVSILFLVALLLTVELHSHNRVYANTHAGDLELGYMEYDTARDELRKQIITYFQTPLVFELDGEQVSLTPLDLGIRPSVEQTTGALPVIDFENTNPVKLIGSLFAETGISPVYTMDGESIIRKLEEKFNLAGKRAKGARFHFVEGELQIEKEQSGVMINREKLLEDLTAKIADFENGALSLELIPEEPGITSETLAAQKDRLLGLLNRDVTLKYEDFKLVLKPVDHLDAVNFEVNADGEGATGTQVNIAMDQYKLEGFLQENLYSKIEIPTSPANIYTAEDGKVIIEGKGEDGRAVAKKDLISAVSLAVNNGAGEVEIPVHVEKAPLTISEDLQELGIRELIATGHSAYYGSPANRMFNIEFGTAKYNGMLIEPGKEFSFNDVLGPVDAASGFKPEKVIKKDKLEYEYGGGICQVSTTFYRAALLAGLPITERRPHSWKVSYYSQSMGDGLDATIYPGVSDLKFVNDTPAWLLVQAYTEGAEAYFKIYGTSDGRTVAMDGPHGGGLTYRWNRTVSKNGKDVTEEIWSRYRPIPPPEPAAPAKPVTAASNVEAGGSVNFTF